MSQSAIDTFFDRIPWWIDEVVQKLKNEIVPRIRDREILTKLFIKTFFLTVVRSSFKLEKILKRFQLDIQKIRIVDCMLVGREAESFGRSYGCGHGAGAVSYTHLRAHETVLDFVCRLLLEKKKEWQQRLLMLCSTTEQKCRDVLL